MRERLSPEKNSGNGAAPAAYDEAAVRKLLSDAMKEVAEKLVDAEDS